MGDGALDVNSMLASLMWGTIGGGYLLYARRQREAVPFVGGVAMLAASFLVASWLWMSVICVGLMFAVWWLEKRGH